MEPHRPDGAASDAELKAALTNINEGIPQDAELHREWFHAFSQQLSNEEWSKVDLDFKASQEAYQEAAYAALATQAEDAREALSFAHAAKGFADFARDDAAFATDLHEPRTPDMPGGSL